MGVVFRDREIDCLKESKVFSTFQSLIQRDAGFEILTAVRVKRCDISGGQGVRIDAYDVGLVSRQPCELVLPIRSRRRRDGVGNPIVVKVTSQSHFDPTDSFTRIPLAVAIDIKEDSVPDFSFRAVAEVLFVVCRPC